MSDVLRWMCDTYRQALLDCDPDACHRIDLIMARVGQTWISDSTIINPDELVTAADVETRFGLSKVAFWHLVRRHQIESRGKRDGALQYRLGDVLAVRKKVPK